MGEKIMNTPNNLMSEDITKDDSSKETNKLPILNPMQDGDQSIVESLRKNQDFIVCPKCLTSGAEHSFVPYHIDNEGWLIGGKGYSYNCSHDTPNDLSNSPTSLQHNRQHLGYTSSQNNINRTLSSSINMDSHGTFQESCSHYESSKIVKTLPQNFELFKAVDESKHFLNFDIEDLVEKFHHHQFSTPLVIDLPLVDSQGNVKPLDEIDTNLDLVLEKSKGLDIVLRIHGKLANDITLINKRVSDILHLQKRKKMEGFIIVLDLSADRICALVQMENSVLLNPLIHPSVHIAADRGEEQEACKELLIVMDSIQHISNISLIVNILISKPYPDLVPILALLRSHKGLCKFILFELERDTSQIMQQFQNFDANVNAIPTEELSYLDMNPNDLLNYIAQCSAGSIGVSDFFPASYGILLEPFLKWMKIGNFHIRPAPACGFCTILVNSEKYTSVPISQIIDMPYLYKEFIKIFPRLQKVKSFPGFLLMRKLKKILTMAGFRKGTKLPNVLNYLITIDPRKKNEMEKVMNDLQFIVVHNKMDVGCIDVKRRVQCSMCELGGNGSDIIAQCTQII